MVESTPKRHIERFVRFFENAGEIISIIALVPFAIGSIMRGWREDSKSPIIKEDDIHYL